MVVTTVAKYAHICIYKKFMQYSPLLYLNIHIYVCVVVQKNSIFSLRYWKIIKLWR